LKWIGLYWEEKKQGAEGGKEGIQINSKISDHRRKKTTGKINESLVRSL